MKECIVADNPESGGFTTAGGVRIFLFPDSYNHLRIELHTHWPAIWKDVQWSMAFDAEIFVEKMQLHTDRAYKITAVTSKKELEIEHICNCFLNYLRKKRGVQ